MAFSVNKFNKNSLFDYKLPEDSEFKKLSTLDEGKTYTIHGLFISTKGKFGDHPVAVGDTFYIDLPKNTLDTVKEMLNDEETVAAINAGLVGITPESYHSKTYDKDCVGVKWVDVTPETPFN